MRPSQRNTAEGILFTDQYQLTMAQLYYRMGMQEMPAQFDHFFRKYPDYGSHKAGYCINAGMEWFLDWIESSRFRKKDIHYLSGQKGRSGERLFNDDFLKWLYNNGDFSGISIQAVSEGRVIHPNEPVTVVQGPLAMAQILETPLLNYLNYPILVATKAARLRESAGKQMILDFGMRRGHERGVNAGIRAALIGGADYSSGVGISHILGFPPKGTHAHSMVEAFIALGEGELGAFRAYANVYPDDCLLLVDTIDTLESGIPNAIRVFEELKRRGCSPFGIRLDSGDLAYLSIKAARMLDRAGFPDTTIVLSNQLDELIIQKIIQQIREKAPGSGVDADTLIRRLVFGVGTRLITSAGDAALDGVYKMVAVRKNEKWIPAIKLSESISKIINPGLKNLWRIYDKQGKAITDLLAVRDESFSDLDRINLYHSTELGKSIKIKRDDISRAEPLLKDIMEQGVILEDSCPIDEMRIGRDRDIESLEEGVRQLVDPQVYHVSLSERLWNLKNKMIEEIKK